MTVDPYDALLLLSFGGPEKPEDVVPFLENVTRGRGIPRERLEEVGEHYYLFGGKSPINDLNRAFLAAIEEDLRGAGIDLPVYWGNRNWAPYLADTVAQMKADGIRRAAVFTTSAYSSWSSCRQYLDNLADAALEDGPRMDHLRPYFNHPGFIEANVAGVLETLAEMTEQQRSEVHLAFVTHSIPTAMNEASGRFGAAYTKQHRSVMSEVVDRVAAETGLHPDHALVFCSRSGAPHIPWLEPDVNDHLTSLAKEGVRTVVMVPIGFVSDHMEVVYDLDTEAMATAKDLGITAFRAPTAGLHPAFVATVRDLLLERAGTERDEDPPRRAVGSQPACWDVCDPGCCGSGRP